MERETGCDSGAAGPANSRLALGGSCALLHRCITTVTMVAGVAAATARPRPRWYASLSAARVSRRQAGCRPVACSNASLTVTSHVKSGSRPLPGPGPKSPASLPPLAAAAPTGLHPFLPGYCPLPTLEAKGGLQTFSWPGWAGEHAMNSWGHRHGHTKPTVVPRRAGVPLAGRPFRQSVPHSRSPEWWRRTWWR